jgi:hypothetical protein
MAAEVLLVEETPSLGSSLVALLEAEGLTVRRFSDLAAAEQFHADRRSAHRLVLVASNAHYCPSASRWALGPLGDAHLVVVGTRDPALRSAGRLHVVHLPLEPARLLELVRGLLGNDLPAPGLARPTGS